MTISREISYMPIIADKCNRINIPLSLEESPIDTLNLPKSNIMTCQQHDTHSDKQENGRRYSALEMDTSF